MTKAWGIDDHADAAVDAGICFGDIDGDGALDILGFKGGAYTDNRRIKVYHNELPKRHWLNVRPVGLAGNKAAAGTKIRVYEEGGLGNAKQLVSYEQVAIWARQVCHSYYSYVQTERHFGLGDRKAVDLSVEFYPVGQEDRTESRPGGSHGDRPGRSRVTMEHWADYVRFVTAILVILNPAGRRAGLPGPDAQSVAPRRNQTAAAAAMTIACVLLARVLSGEWVLRLFGINVPCFQVGGGILVLLMAISMLHAKSSRIQQTPAERRDAEEQESVGVVPLGTPLLAGPGSISTAIIYANKATTGSTSASWWRSASWPPSASGSCCGWPNRLARSWDARASTS